MPKNVPAMTWTPTPKFRIGDFRGTYRYDACRAAVMGSIFGRGIEFSSQKGYDELRKRWHAKLEALYAAKWQPLSDRKALVYMRNCPPFGVLTKDKSSCCNRDFICPFCYARRHVERPFKRFEEILYGPGIEGEKHVLLRPDLKILSFRLSTNGTVKAGRELNVETLPAHWERAKNYIRANRTYEKTRFEPDYGTMHFKVYPLQTHLGVTRTGVFLIRGEVPASVLEEYNTKGEVRIYEPSKKNLRDASVHAFAYSSELMTHRDAGLLARLMEMRGRLRLTTPYWKEGVKYEREQLNGGGQITAEFLGRLGFLQKSETAWRLATPGGDVLVLRTKEGKAGTLMLRCRFNDTPMPAPETREELIQLCRALKIITKM